MNKPSWQDIAGQVQLYRAGTVAKIQPRLPDVPRELPCNVTKIPQELLSAHEVKITESAAEDLLTSLATGQLTSTEVTNAFLRRAALAQKLESSTFLVLPARSNKTVPIDQLRYRTAAGTSSSACKGTRRVFCRAQKAHRCVAWASDQCQGVYWHERTGLQRRICGVGRESRR